MRLVQRLGCRARGADRVCQPRIRLFVSRVPDYQRHTPPRNGFGIVPRHPSGMVRCVVAGIRQRADRAVRAVANHQRHAAGRPCDRRRQPRSEHQQHDQRRRHPPPGCGLATHRYLLALDRTCPSRHHKGRTSSRRSAFAARPRRLARLRPSLDENRMIPSACLHVNRSRAPEGDHSPDRLRHPVRRATPRNRT